MDRPLRLLECAWADQPPKVLARPGLHVVNGALGVEVRREQLSCRALVPVDIIVTPTRVIRVGEGRAPKPSGVMWELLSPQKLAQIRVLRDLKRRIEEETGQALPQGPDETLPPKVLSIASASSACRKCEACACCWSRTLRNQRSLDRRWAQQRRQP